MNAEFRPFGVEVPEEYLSLLREDRLDFHTIMKAPNTEVRRALCQLIDLEGQLSAPVSEDAYGSLHTTPAGGLFLRLADPSTGRVYIHPTIDDQTKSPAEHRAMRWTVYCCSVCSEISPFSKPHPTAIDTGQCFMCTREDSPRRYSSDFTPGQEA